MSNGAPADMRHFSVTIEQIDLPRAATPQARRVAVAWRGRPICAFTQGAHRCYLYPLYSPAGVPLTAESPVDHPHHDSITVGADMVTAKFPPLTPAISPLAESATYNLYANQVFQRPCARTDLGRGYQRDRGWPPIICAWCKRSSGKDRRSGARPTVGGLLALETRTTDIRPGDVVNTVDIRSQLRPTEWDLTIGPTRHAFFTVRLAYGLRVDDGGALVDADGRCGGAAITNRTSAWVDASGPAPHGARAGLAILPHASTAQVPWVAYDWGTVVVNPFAREPREVRRGDTLDLGNPAARAR